LNHIEEFDNEGFHKKQEFLANAAPTDLYFSVENNG
jgi:hypothetical protein